jgi:hypothetical protein
MRQYFYAVGKLFFKASKFFDAKLFLNKIYDSKLFLNKNFLTQNYFWTKYLFVREIGQLTKVVAFDEVTQNQGLLKIDLTVLICSL